MKRFDDTPTLSFRVSDVTGTRDMPVEVQRGLPAGAVARSVAARMNLDSTVPWALRDDASCVYLDDDRPIGDQLEPDAVTCLTPKTHLG